MKNVILLRAVVRDHARHHLLCPIRTRRQLGRYAATLALGLPVIALLARLFDPTAPFACIVWPVVAGGLLPALALLPGRAPRCARCSACRSADHAGGYGVPSRCR